MQFLTSDALIPKKMYAVLLVSWDTIADLSNYITITAPLSDLTKNIKLEVLQWTSDCQKAFDDTKQL